MAETPGIWMELGMSAIRFDLSIVGNIKMKMVRRHADVSRFLLIELHHDFYAVIYCVRHHLVHAVVQ